MATRTVIKKSDDSLVFGNGNDVTDGMVSAAAAADILQLKTEGSGVEITSDGFAVVRGTAEDDTVTIAGADKSMNINLGAGSDAIVVNDDITIKNLKGVESMTGDGLSSVNLNATVNGLSTDGSLSIDGNKLAQKIVYTTIVGESEVDLGRGMDMITFEGDVTVTREANGSLKVASTEGAVYITNNDNNTNLKIEANGQTVKWAKRDDLVNEGSTYKLGVAQDEVSGTAGNDTFQARIVNNANTLQSGDVIEGGAGTDILTADVGNSQAFAVTAETTGVEHVAIRAQAISVDSTDNNTSKTNEVQIDAQRMVGVTTWESTNSRADLLIEDVRILDNQITSDVTIVMRETDPGHVDYGVYFDQNSLRSQKVDSSTLTIELADTRSLANGGAALKDNPYWGFKFLLGGVEQTVTSDAIDAAQTYAELLTAVQAALAANTALAGVTAALGTNVTRTDTISGQTVTVTPLVLSNSGTASLNTVSTGDAWLAKNGVPASSGLHTYMTNASSSATTLVTSKIVLDDVGRGSTGGDLVVGGLSVGDTSTSKGVQRFEIEVQDNSKLQTINSTNNTLQEVKIVNGTTSRVNNAYNENQKDAGALTVNGEVLTGQNGTIHAALPGTETAMGGDQHNAYGFSDVRLIDASAMTGKLAFTAEVTTASIAKYVNLTDTAAPAADNVNVVYTGGSNNDTMVVDISADVAGSRSNVVSGREDFTFSMNGGAGDDAITLKVTTANVGNGQDWYHNQDLNNNITVDGGTGNDVIRTPGAGDMVINAGAGNDVVYADNTGAQANILSTANGSVNTVNKAAWVFNTVNQSVVVPTAAEMDYRDLDDVRSDANTSNNLYKSTVTVTFKGIASKAITVESTSYKTTDLQINQAIKNAINSDATLKNLLVAKDGPANSLIVESLIDGVMVRTDLSVAIATPVAGALSAAEIAAAGAAYGIATPTEATVLAAMGVAKTAFDTKGDYASALATDEIVNLTGANSTTTSDNTITGGAGDDVIVLGTTAGADATSNYDDSNDTVVVTNEQFGNDVVVHFNAANDRLDFTAIGGANGNFGSTVANKSIVVAVEGTTNDTAAEVAAMFTDNGAAATTASTHVYVAYSAHNIGKVYAVTDAAGVGGITATQLGTIDLADTGWGTLTDANFVLSTYNSGTVAAVVVPPAAGTATVAVSAAGTVIDSDTINTTYNVASGSYTYTIDNFGAGDKLAMFAGASVSVTPDASDTDGIQTLTAANAATGQTVTITLTGLSATEDAGLFNTGSFSTVFGAGTLA